MTFFIKIKAMMAVLLCIITGGNVFTGLLNYTRAGDVCMIKNDHEKAFETECGMVVTFGEAAENITNAFIEKGGSGKAFRNKAELTDYLRENLKEGDTVLFKGSRGMKMEEIFTSLYKEWEV